MELEVDYLALDPGRIERIEVRARTGGGDGGEEVQEVPKEEPKEQPKRARKSK
jgi:hypothetical protein